MRFVFVLTIGLVVIMCQAYANPEAVANAEPEPEAIAQPEAEAHKRAANRCQNLCVYNRRNQVCGEPIDHPKLPHRLFFNYCALRQHNCLHPKSRYRAELGLAQCLKR